MGWEIGKPSLGIVSDSRPRLYPDVTRVTGKGHAFLTRKYLVDTHFLTSLGSLVQHPTAAMVRKMILASKFSLSRCG